MEDATKDYTAARERVDRQIRQVQKLLHAHANKATASPRDRAFIGDLIHVADVLNEVVEFLGGTKEEIR